MVCLVCWELNPVLVLGYTTGWAKVMPWGAGWRCQAPGNCDRGSVHVHWRTGTGRLPLFGRLTEGN